VSDSPAKDAEDPGFDALLERLRAVVTRLEEGNLSLEESLRAYEEGVALARSGHAVLDRAEKRVELLVEGADGDGARVPLDGTDDRDTDDAR
jgi:exodeoxyribonuclease VII small subunit